MGGEFNVEGESLSCQLHFRRARKKNCSAGSFKFRENSFREGTRRVKNRLKIVICLLCLLARTKFVILHVVVLCSIIEIQIMAL